MIERNFLDNYVRAHKHLESPEIFHQWAALVLAGAAMGRNTWASLGSMRVYPNLYVALVASPGQGRKSSAMSAAAAVYRRAINPEGPITKQYTAKALAHRALKQEDHRLTLFVSELTMLLAEPGMADFLADLYDPAILETPLGKIRVGASVLAATTPQAVVEEGRRMNSQAFRHRTILVLGKDQRKILVPQTFTDEEAAAHTLAVEELSQMTSICGAYSLNSKSTRLFDKWYTSLPKDHDPRLPMRLIKLCIIVQASKSNAKVLSHHAFEEALSLLPKG